MSELFFLATGAGSPLRVGAETSGAQPGVTGGFGEALEVARGQLVAGMSGNALPRAPQLPGLAAVALSPAVKVLIADGQPPGDDALMAYARQQGIDIDQLGVLLANTRPLITQPGRASGLGEGVLADTPEAAPQAQAGMVLPLVAPLQSGRFAPAVSAATDTSQVPGLVLRGEGDPTIVRSGVAPPVVVQLGGVQSAIAQPGVAQPLMTPSGVAQPLMTQSGVVQPGVTPSGAVPPAVAVPGSGEPAGLVQARAEGVSPGGLRVAPLPVVDAPAPLRTAAGVQTVGAEWVRPGWSAELRAESLPVGTVVQAAPAPDGGALQALALRQRMQQSLEPRAENVRQVIGQTPEVATLRVEVGRDAETWLARLLGGASTAPAAASARTAEHFAPQSGSVSEALVGQRQPLLAQDPRTAAGLIRETSTPQETILKAQEDYTQLSRRLGEMVAQRLAAEVQRGNWTVQMQLHPAQLGMVSVRMAMSDGVLRAQFSASQGLTRELLVDGLPRLRTELEQAGLTTGEMSVGQGGDNPLAGRHGARQGPPQPGGTATREALANTVAQAEGRPAGGETASGRIDLRA